MTIQTNLTRRAALAGTAALPALALTRPAAAETKDPAIAAVRRWEEACMAERAYHYTGDGDRNDDPTAQQFEDDAGPALLGDGADRPDHGRGTGAAADGPPL